MTHRATASFGKMVLPPKPEHRVHYIDGSPPARIVRATMLEFRVPFEAVLIRGFPPAGVERLNPAMQVPVLETPVGPLFGSDVIRRYLHSEHGRQGAYSPVLTRAERHWHDLTVLSAADTLQEALGLHFHMKWAGCEQQGVGRLGVDIAEREMARAVSILDWLEQQAEAEDSFRPGTLSAPDFAVAASVLWTEAREPIPWAEGRPRLAAIAARVAERESFRETAPTPWT